MFDIREQQVILLNSEWNDFFNFMFFQNGDGSDESILNGPNQLDKERNMMVDDPKWQG